MEIGNSFTYYIFVKAWGEQLSQIYENCGICLIPNFESWTTNSLYIYLKQFVIVFNFVFKAIWLKKLYLIRFF